LKELGDLIRGAREARGIPLEQASAETRIRRAYLDAIEEGDFHIFPGTAYATGFLRNYATYLGLNSDEILQTYHAISPPSRIAIAPATTVGLERLRRRSRRKTIWSAVAICLLGLSVYAITSYNNSQTPATPHFPPLTPTSSVSDRGDTNADHIPNLVHARAVIRVYAVHTAWVRVMKNGHQIAWTPIPAGSTHTWHGHSLQLWTHRGTAIRVWVNGTRAWHVSKSRGRVGLVAGPYTWHRAH